MARTLEARIALACLATFMSMSCAGTPKSASAGIEAAGTDPITEIRFSTRSRGNVYESWTIRRDGGGQYVSAEHARASPSMAQALKGSPTDFDTLLRDLVPLEQQINKPLHCSEMWTDQDVWTVTWARQGSSATLELYLGCRSQTMTQLRAALQQSRGHIAEMAAAGKAQ